MLNQDDIGMEEYQRQAMQTAVYPMEAGIIYTVMGLAGEAGEVAKQVKKAIRDDGGVITAERRHAIRDELGDVLWYVAVTAMELGYSLDSIAQMNLVKLEDRQTRGQLQGAGDER